MSVYIVEKGGKYIVKINLGIDKRTKRPMRTQRTVSTRDVAEALVRKINAQIELGTFSIATSGAAEKEMMPTVAEFTGKAIDRMYPASRKGPTNERYHNVLNKDIVGATWPRIGDKRIDEVTAMDIYDLLCSLVDEGRTSKSIDLTRTVLRCCFKVAKLDRLIAENPMNDLPRMKYEGNDDADVEDTEEKPDEVNPYTEEEMVLFIDAAMKYSPHMYGPLFLCGFRTGMRLGELLAMRWEHIDWDRGVIRVFRSYRRAKLGKTKTRKHREVEISAQLHSVLRELLARRVAEARGGQAQSIIFHSKGHYRSQNAVRKAFKKVISITGLPDRRVHDMRHTFASILLSKGGTLAYIKAQLGHKKLSTTSDLYARFIPGTNRGMVSLLDSPIGVSGEQTEEA